MTDFSAWMNKHLIKDIKGQVLVEYALVLTLLSVVVWIVIIGVAVAVANQLQSIAAASGAAATNTLPSIPAPDS